MDFGDADVIEEMQTKMLNPTEAGKKWGMASVPLKDKGVATFVLGHGDVWKMLRYDIERLVMKGGIWTLFDKGTICTVSTKIPIQIAKYPVVALIFWAIAKSIVESGYEMNVEHVMNLVNQLSSVTPFVLGLYLSVVIGRWWSLRMCALGSVFDSTSNVTMLLAALTPSEQHAASRAAVYRWCTAGVHLLVKAARNIATFDDLVKEGYLTQEEANVIEAAPVYQRPQVAWAWVGRAVREAQQRGAITGPFLGQLMGQVVNARNGLDTIQTYLDTQLPFAYVHLITLMVSLTNFSVAFKCGIVLGSEYAKAVVAKEKVDRLLIFNECFFVIVIPLVYDGLLSISYMIHDPFGSDILDFPVTAYLASVVDNCSAVQYAQQVYPGAFFPEKIKGYETQDVRAPMSLYGAAVPDRVGTAPGGSRAGAAAASATNADPFPPPSGLPGMVPQNDNDSGEDDDGDDGDDDGGD